MAASEIPPTPAQVDADKVAAKPADEPQQKKAKSPRRSLFSPRKKVERPEGNVADEKAEKKSTRRLSLTPRSKAKRKQEEEAKLEQAKLEQVKLEQEKEEAAKCEAAATKVQAVQRGNTDRVAVKEQAKEAEVAQTLAAVQLRQCREANNEWYYR